VAAARLPAASASAAAIADSRILWNDASTQPAAALVFDVLDGRVARLTNTQSEFGVQYDSLSDLVSFGLAPALVMYTWSLSSLAAYGPVWGKIGWAAAFIYAVCAALRLARFNTQVGVADKRYFQGLASPAAAGLCMSFVWTMEKFDIPGPSVAFFAMPLAVIAGLLMAEMVARRGRSIGDQLKELFGKYGSFYPVRENFRLTGEVKQKFTEKVKKDPTELAGLKVKQVVRTDGLKLIFDDGSARIDKKEK